MLVMAKKKPGRPPGRRPTIALQARIPEEMHQALGRLAEHTRRTRNTELVIALEKHLKAEGFWPPEPPG